MAASFVIDISADSELAARAFQLLSIRRDRYDAPGHDLHHALAIAQPKRRSRKKPLIDGLVLSGWQPGAGSQTRGDTQSS